MEALQRVYGVSFPDDEMMVAWVKSQQEAGSRDHRRIGKVGGAGRPGRAGAASARRGRVSQTHRLKHRSSSRSPIFCSAGAQSWPLGSFVLTHQRLLTAVLPATLDVLGVKNCSLLPFSS